MILFLVLLLINEAQYPGWDHMDESARCLSCHQHFSLLDDDSASTRFTVRLSSEKYRESDHGHLSCIHCHGDDFTAIPHTHENRIVLHCGGCHGDAPMPCSYHPYSTYENSYGGDIHTVRVNGFRCGSCHDPHMLTISRCNPPERTNILCIRCHSGTSLITSHFGFPGTRLHLKHCSCSDCHFHRDKETVSHFVLPKEASLRNCRSCHNKNMTSILFPDRIQSWEKRQIPGWRSGMTIEIFFGILAIVVWTGAMLSRLFRSGSSALTRLLPPGPSSMIRGISIAILFLTGFTIYAGNGFFLAHAAHIHVLAGVLLLAIILERIYLIRGLPWNTVFQVVLRFRSILIGVLLVTGIMLLTPSITGVIDDFIPCIRAIHRFSAVTLLIWFTAIAIRD